MLSDAQRTLVTSSSVQQEDHESEPLQLPPWYPAGAAPASSVSPPLTRPSHQAHQAQQLPAPGPARAPSATRGGSTAKSAPNSVTHSSQPAQGPVSEAALRVAGPPAGPRAPLPERSTHPPKIAPPAPPPADATSSVLVPELSVAEARLKVQAEIESSTGQDALLGYPSPPEECAASEAAAIAAASPPSGDAPGG